MRYFNTRLPAMVVVFVARLVGLGRSLVSCLHVDGSLWCSRQPLGYTRNSILGDLSQGLGLLPGRNLDNPSFRRGCVVKTMICGCGTIQGVSLVDSLCRDDLSHPPDRAARGPCTAVVTRSATWPGSQAWLGWRMIVRSPAEPSRRRGFSNSEYPARRILAEEMFKYPLGAHPDPELPTRSMGRRGNLLRYRCPRKCISVDDLQPLRLFTLSPNGIRSSPAFSGKVSTRKWF